jgi:hypothetical protein
MLLILAPSCNTHITTLYKSGYMLYQGGDTTALQAAVAVAQ